MGDQASADGTPELVWVGMPESWGVFVLIAIVLLIIAGVFWMYTREIETCPRPLKILLGCMRFAVLLLLVLMFLRPSMVFTTKKVIKPNIVMLRDSSLSFSRKDRYLDPDTAEKLAKATGRDAERLAEGQASRGELLNEALQHNQSKVLRQLLEKGAVQFVDFAEVISDSGVLPATDTSRPDDEQEGPRQVSVPPLIANGRGTDISYALREKLSDSGRTSALILSSDGQHNGTDDLMELADRARELDIPIHTIGVGDPSRPKNLSVDKLYIREKISVNEPFAVEASMYVEDYQEDSILVELLQHELSAEGAMLEGVAIDSKDVDIPDGGGRLRHVFSHKVQQAGNFKYTVRIAEVDGESNTDDNTNTSGEVKIVDQKVKVLLIAGAPTWEYRMLQRLFQRDSNIVFTGWLQTMDTDRPQEGNDGARISEMPENFEDLAEYNVIMMIDPDPRYFPDGWMDNLKRFCRVKAGGVFFMAGPKHTNMFVTLNRLSGIRDILPVRFGDEEFIETNQVLATTSNSRPGKMLLVNPNLGHPVMSFVNDFEENLRLWNLMPSIYWSFPTLSAKPTSLTLMERGDQINISGNQPLLVAGRYGAGNVVYMGFNGTWRWRRVGTRAQYFDRFWIQVVNFLVETRSLQGQRRGFIDTDRNTYELGETITLKGEALNERFEYMEVPALAAQVISDEGRVRDIELKLLPGQPGQYEAAFKAFNTGDFRVKVDLPGTDANTEVEEVRYVVKPPSVESRGYWLNEKQLRDIADASGGKYFTLDQLDQLHEHIPQLESTSSYSTPPKPLWEVSKRIRWIVFLLPVVLLTIEWAIRKKTKLL